MTGPLADLHVVECASFVAGPTGGMTLAQLGADVVRIDPLGGGSDLHRWPVAPGGASYYWASLNTGKRSVAVDMRSEEGSELVLALITAPGPGRGILVDNVVGRRWMDPERLRERRVDLIHLRLQGHPDGRPAVDYTVNAEAGVPTITGPEGLSAPVNHVFPAWDLAAGMTVAAGVLAALHERDRTGRGRFLELALADVALAGVANLGWLSEAADRGRERPRHGNHVYGSFGVDVECRDGTRVMVVALTPGQWTALQQVTGTTEVFGALAAALGADLDDEAERYRLRETIAAIIRPWFADRDVARVSEELDGARVLWGRYRRMPEIVAAHGAGNHPVLADITLPGGEQAITARSPLRLDGDHGPVGRVPALGRETAEVLAEALHLTSAEIGGLHQRGVIDVAGNTGTGSER
ncbi:CoA transferase [Pseudonocardia broussonetiae]|uniref:CoA transferase n=1 Tax=Pseudonocardia broussonetiae TaxID=2736640 RepID=UPI001F03F2AD|nr:CoA transferase [Pseudonocardia broussonetiae]